MKITRATAEQADFAERKGVTAVAAERKDKKNTIGKKKTVDLVRSTETSVEVDAPPATPDERGRCYQEAFETVYDASERLTPMVPTESGFRIEPASSTFQVDQYNQNAMPGVEEDDVAQATLKEHRKADKDYPGGHPKAQPTSQGFDPDGQ
jgi:hypothetical protein